MTMYLGFAITTIFCSFLLYMVFEAPAEQLLRLIYNKNTNWPSRLWLVYLLVVTNKPSTSKEAKLTYSMIRDGNRKMFTHAQWYLMRSTGIPYLVRFILVVRFMGYAQLIISILFENDENDNVQMLLFVIPLFILIIVNWTKDNAEINKIN